MEQGSPSSPPIRKAVDPSPTFRDCDLQVVGDTLVLADRRPHLISF